VEAAGRGLNEGYSSHQAIAFTRRTVHLSLIERRLSDVTVFGPLHYLAPSSAPVSTFVRGSRA